MLAIRRRWTRLRLLELMAWVLIVLCPANAARPQPTIDWPTFGGSNGRNNYNASETTLSTHNVSGLKLHWRSKRRSAVKVQPVLVRNVITASGSADLLIVVEYGGAVTALNAATGEVVWSTAVPPIIMVCARMSKTIGIAAPVTLDLAAQRAYVVDASGNLHALALSSGVELAGYPVEIIDAANLAAGTYVHFFSPTLVGSSLYVGTASFCESSLVPYHGQLIQFDTTSATVLGRFYPMGNGSVFGGGFWGTGGLAVEPDQSILWGSTANALPPPEDTGNSEKIVALTQGMQLIAADGPVFPKSGDLDFGSTPLLFQPPGCPPMLAALNKSGIIVVYNRMSLVQGPTQIVTISNGSGMGKLIGMPSYNPETNAIYVNNPLDSADGTYRHGLVALQVNAHCQLGLLWQQTLGENGNVSPSVTPMIANGVVYLSEGLADAAAAFNATTGEMLWNSGTMTGAVVAPPVVANGQVFFASGRYVDAYGL